MKEAVPRRTFLYGTGLTLEKAEHQLPVIANNVRAIAANLKRV
jgi:hypothetical protein